MVEALPDTQGFFAEVDVEAFPEFLDSTSFSPIQLSAWPWLHENLFFQNDLPETWYQTTPPEALEVRAKGQPISSNAAINGSRSDLPVVAGSTVPQLPVGSLTSRNGLQVPSSLENAGLRQRPEEHVQTSSIQLNIVNDLIALAREDPQMLHTKRVGSTCWKPMSTRVHSAFHLGTSEEVEDLATYCLEHFVTLYQRNFSQLWPFLSQHTFDPKNMHPVLFLTLGSIGSMYGGAHSSQYGTLMHEHIRDLLAEPLFDFQLSEENSVAIAQARALTQVAALYFGHKRAFSYAQHLGSVLIAQARRMDLFCPPRHQKEVQHVPDIGSNSAVGSQWVSRWIRAETRKRLAYAILRLEAYTSVLLNTRPLLCSDEIQLELPCSPFLWLTKFESDAQFITAVRQDAATNHREKILFSDLVRVALDDGESCPPLDAISQELLVFGLQEQVWRVSQDPECLSRLTGVEDNFSLGCDGLDMNEGPIASSSSRGVRNTGIASHSRVHVSVTSLDDQFPSTARTMYDVRQDRRKVSYALLKWRRLFNKTFTRHTLTLNDRSSLMSSLLLYHLSFVRVFAPLEKLHHISYHSDDDQIAESTIVYQVWAWSHNRKSRISVQHACIIWNLLFTECGRPAQDKARFNYLALIGLHHAAVVIWTFAGTHEPNSSSYSSSGEEDELLFGVAEDAASRLTITKPQSSVLMAMFVELFDRISPAWAVRSSFAAAAARLAKTSFPQNKAPATAEINSLHRKASKSNWASGGY